MRLPKQPSSPSIWVRFFAIDYRSLAALRVGVSIVLLWNLLDRLRDFRMMYTDAGIAPVDEVSSILGRQFWLWSLHLWSGHPAYQGCLFAGSLLAAVCLLLGIGGRWASLISWVLLASLHVRTPFLVSGGDVLLSMFLFWGIFLPWDACLSIRRRVPAGNGTQTLSVATAAVLLQIVFMYFMTGLSKCNDVWFTGQALSNTFGFSLLARPAGQWLLRFPTLLQGLTWFTLAIELAAPLLFFCPWKTRQVRSVGLSLFLLLHLGIELTMRVVIFSWISGAGLMAFVAGQFWERLGWRLDREPRVDVYRNRFVSSVGGCVLLAVLTINGWMNLSMYFPFPAPPDSLLAVIHVPVMAQRWDMFKHPEPGDYRFLALALLENGEQVDLLRPETPVQLHDPKAIPVAARNARWLNLFLETRRAHNARYVELWLTRLSRQWDAAHPAPQRISLAQMVFMREPAANADAAALVLLAQFEPGTSGRYLAGQRHGYWEFQNRQGRRTAAGSFQRGQRQGMWKTWYDTGVLKSQGAYLNDQPHGDWTYWHPSGQKSGEGAFDQGQKEGNWTYWYADGGLEGQGPYQQDEMHGEWTFWMEDGEVTQARFDHGRRIVGNRGAESLTFEPLGVDSSDQAK